MARFEITAPDGQRFEITAPEGATQEQALAFAQKQFAQAPKPSPQQPPNPTDGMSTFDRAAAGLGKGVTDFATGAKQRLDEAAAGLEALIPGGKAISRAFGGKTAADIKAQGQAAITEQKRLDAPLMNTTAGSIGSMAGNIIPGAFMGPLGAVGSGVAMGAATPTTEGTGEVLQNMAVGGVAGKVGEKLTNAFASAVKPNVNKQVQMLMDAGVIPTPGQILGGNFAKAESRATSLPIVGDAIANAQRRGGEQLNRAAFNRALEPIGEKLPMQVKVGREAVDHVQSALGDAYEKLLPKLTVQLDDQFSQKVGSLKTMVSEGALDPKISAKFDQILQNRVLGKFQGQNAMTGQTLKDTESYLGSEIKRFGMSQDPDARLLGDALKELQSNLRGLVQRSNPDYARELQAINTGWANFKRVQRAAAGIGAEDGVFSPAQLQNAVKALDKSKDKARFAEGNALMQDLSEAGKSVMGLKYPDSGTAGRLMNNTGAIASGFVNPAIPLGLLAGSGAYSAPAQKAFAALLAKRPASAGLLADNIRAFSPSMGILGASGGLALNQ